jgi:predicted membrane protein (TIGR00267 family)
VEQYRELRRIEEAMVSKDMKGSEPERQVSRKTITIGAVDGFATVIGGGIPILPYLFLPTSEAMLAAIGVVIAVVSVIGIYLGKLSRRNMALSALKMALFCIVVAAVVYLVQSLIVPT